MAYKRILDENETWLRDQVQRKLDIGYAGLILLAGWIMGTDHDLASFSACKLDHTASISRTAGEATRANEIKVAELAELDRLKGQAGYQEQIKLVVAAAQFAHVANEDAKAAEEEKSISAKSCSVAWGLIAVPAILLLAWWFSVARYFYRVSGYDHQITLSKPWEIIVQVTAVSILIIGLVIFVVAD
jgi:hypothetical protein